MTTYRARRLPKQPGPSGWNALLPARRRTAPLDRAITADVAIVGAGFAGLSAAHRLAELDPTAKVAVLESGQVGEGPAGRNSGFMIDLPHDLASEDYAGAGPEQDRAQIARNRIAIGFARDFSARAGLPREVFDPAGKINAAATGAGDAHNRRFRDYLDAIGETSTLLDARDMAQLTGSGFYLSGLHHPGTAIIQPAAYIRALADGLGNGPRLLEGSPVTAITRTGASWRLDTPGGSVTAPKVILANNGQAESFGFHARRLMHVFTYASMTEALSADQIATLGGAPRWAVTPADPMGTSVRRISGTGGDRIVVRARFTYDPAMQVSDRRLSAVGRMHDVKFGQRFPMLGRVAMQYRWAGHLCLSWNGVPAFGEVEDGIHSAVCQNGLGTVKGTLAGLAAAEAVLGRPGTALAAFDGRATPRKLPPEPFAWLGATATMRWKEWRAGRE